MRRLSLVPTLVALLLIAGCDDPTQPVARPDPQADAPKHTSIIGKTTDRILPAAPELEQGGAQVASQAITARDPITLSGNAYVSIIGQTAILQIDHAMNLYHALNGRYPENFEEFQREIIEANGIRLPQLPPYQEYGYDENAHKLVILEYPDRQQVPR